MKRIIDLVNPSDAFNEGYQAGLSDAIASKPKFIKHSVYARYAFTLINREEFLKSFQDGYNTGYTDGLRKKNQIFAIEDHANVGSILNNNLKTSNMSKQTSYAYQIELMEALKSYLDKFQDRLGAVAQNYENRVNDLYESGGMMHETYEDFHTNYLEVTKSKIQDLIDQINDEDIPFVERQIDHLDNRPT
jgi:hypothetical protein